MADDLGLIRHVGGLFPDLMIAAEKHKKTIPSSESRSLTRHLVIEAALYQQFTRKLLLATHASSTQDDELGERIQTRLGPKAAERMFTRLKQLEGQLRSLKADLTGAEVWDKLRAGSTDMRAKAIGVPFKNSLSELSRTNRSLTAHLAVQRPPLPLIADKHEAPNFPLLFRRDRTASTEYFRITGQGYPYGHPLGTARRDCPAHDAHVGALDPWTRDSACAFLVPSQATLISGDVTMTTSGGRDAAYGPPVAYARASCEGQETGFGSSKGLAMVRTPPPVSEGIGADKLYGQPTGTGKLTSRSDVYPGTEKLPINRKAGDSVPPVKEQAEATSCSACAIARLQEALRLSLQDKESERHSLAFQDLIRPTNQIGDQKQRSELAFRLSAAVLRLAATPWVDNSWKWNDWTVSFDQDDMGCASTLCACHPLHSVRLSVEKQAEPNAAWRILVMEPILARLGLSIIELAFGRSLAEIRKHNQGLLSEEDLLVTDPETLDLLTAKRLLLLGRIGEYFGSNLQAAVGACINQQYWLDKVAAIRDLDVNDVSYLEGALLSIIAPLYKEMRSYLRSSGSDSLPRDEDPEQPGTELGDSEWAGLQSDILNKSPSRDQKDIVLGAGEENRSVQADLRHDGSDDHSTHDRKMRTSQITQSPPGREARSEAVTSLSRPLSVKSASSALVTVTSNAYPEVANSSVRNWREAPQSGLLPPPNPSKASGREFEGSLGPPDEDSLASHRRQSSREEYSLAARDEDFEETSSNSSHSSSQSVDSGFSFLTKQSALPLKLPKDHPLWEFKDRMVSHMLTSFQGSGAKECGSGSTATSGTPSQNDSIRPEQGAPSQQKVSGQGTANGRPTSLTIQASSKKRQPKEGSKNFACPFLKKDPEGNVECCRFELNRIRDVKQHLGRCHNMPIYCSLCYDTFCDEDSRDTHTQDRLCDQVIRKKPEGITAQQKTRLAKKAPSKLSPEDQWYGVFDILFPDYSPRPATPYVSNSLLQDVLGYQDFLVREGPSILRDHLTNSGLVSWNQPNHHSDFTAFQQEILRGGLRAIFQSWASQGGINNLAAGSTSSPAQPAPDSVMGDSSEMGLQTPPGQALESTPTQPMQTVPIQPLQIMPVQQAHMGQGSGNNQVTEQPPEAMVEFGSSSQGYTNAESYIDPYTQGLDGWSLSPGNEHWALMDNRAHPLFNAESEDMVFD